MARKGTKSTDISDIPSFLTSEGPSRSREVIGLVMLFLALGLCFALFSFEPGDDEGQRNLVGPLGAAVASAVLRAVGLVGYAAGIAAVLVAGVILFGRLRLPSLVSVLAGLSVLVGGTVLAHLSAVEDATPYPPGGLLGLVAGTLLRQQAGPVGAVLAAVGLVLIGTLTTFRLSLRGAVTTTAGWVVDGVQEVWLHRRIRRDAARAARQRQRDLHEAAREEQAEADRKARLQGNNRRQAFEERARVAVLKATAQAEEEALAQIEGERPVAGSSTPPMATAPVLHPPRAESIEVGVPGPAADPDLIIGVPDMGEFMSSTPALENAADVLERIDRGEPDDPDLIDSEPPPPSVRSLSEPGLVIVDPDSEPTPSDGVPISSKPASARPARSLSARAAAPTEVPSSPPSDLGSGRPEPVDEELIIHERKEVETDFTDDGRTAEPLVPEKPSFVLPPINLLDYEGDGPAPVDQLALKEKATRLEGKLRTYGVEGKVMAIRPGPVVTTYEYQPAPGVKVAKIANLSDDIAMSMEAVRVRIVAPIPGRGVVGIELPNGKRENVYLKEIIAHEAFKHSKSLLTLALGKDAEGEPQVRDLRKMPHLMIAGTTGSGKSVSINTMVLSMLYKATPDEVKFIMVDPKMLELSLYNDIPHLLLPVVTDPKKASLALAWTVDEMERRYKLLSDAKVRDIQGFNKKTRAAAKTARVRP